MAYVLTSCKLKPEYYPPQEVFANSSREEISVSEISDRPHFKSFFTPQDLSQILQVDSSSIYPSFELKKETVVIDEFFRKIKKLKVLEDVSGMLNELTSEQIKIFEAAVKRGPLFK